MNQDPNQRTVMSQADYYAQNPYGTSTAQPAQPQIIINNQQVQGRPQIENSRQSREQKIAHHTFMVNKYRIRSKDGMFFRPKGVYFANQDRDEIIYVLVRQHWATNIGWVIRNFFMALIPIAIIFLDFLLNIKIEQISIVSNLVMLSFYYSLLFTNIIRNFFDWYFDPYFITDQRVIHYEFQPFASYIIKETDLRNIQVVREQGVGFLSTVFGYGNILIATESIKGHFDLIKIPQVTVVRNIVADLQKLARGHNHD